MGRGRRGEEGGVRGERSGINRVGLTKFAKYSTLLKVLYFSKRT